MTLDAVVVIVDVVQTVWPLAKAPFVNAWCRENSRKATYELPTPCCRTSSNFVSAGKVLLV